MIKILFQFKICCEINNAKNNFLSIYLCQNLLFNIINCLI